MDRKARKRIGAAIAGLLVVWYLFCLPKDLFKGTSYSTVVTDRNGELLGARISSDGQWRFPPCDTVPEKFRKSIIEFEDRWFSFHPGVNPVSVVRAAAGNIRAGSIKSGGSTITMQVIRMSRGRERTFRQKIIEAILATRLELRCSKKRILALYASHAPFGGNVVGLEAASWRYFGRPPDELSWGESATLAVLPNSPSDIHLGKNRERLLQKRNRLLQRLHDKGTIDDLELELALGEPLPSEPTVLPQYAWSITELNKKSNPGKRTRTTIDLGIQKQVESVADRWSGELSRTGADDLAVVVEDIRTGEIIAYVGNARRNVPRPGSDVDIARAPRSTGSILKPFLYCSLLQEGTMLPHTLLPDVPVNISGFTPQNFDRQFSGAVKASEALSRSLNVPAVHMLKREGVPAFLDILRRCGMSTLPRSADDYGLSLILGGAEGSLLDMTTIYAKMSAAYQSTGRKDMGGWMKDFPLTDKCALWWTFDALKEVNRPDEIDFHLISSVRKIAWKTGTSYGFRDAWAVGVNSEYAVGVWVGNAMGQGAPGITGARTAGPVMFDIFNLLPLSGRTTAYSKNGWFLEPAPSDGITAEVCHESGCLAGPSCDRVETILLPSAALKSEPCPYHRTIGGERVFILPPSMEWYYRQHHPEYSTVIPEGSKEYDLMEFIYPESGASLYIPRQLDGTVKGVTFNLAHRNPSQTVFWHLDDEYAGKTQFIHQLRLNPPVGKHTVTVVDEDGSSLSIGFTILENKL